MLMYGIEVKENFQSGTWGLGRQGASKASRLFTMAYEDAFAFSAQVTGFRGKIGDQIYNTEPDRHPRFENLFATSVEGGPNQGAKPAHNNSVEAITFNTALVTVNYEPLSRGELGDPNNQDLKDQDFDTFVKEDWDYALEVMSIPSKDKLHLVEEDPGNGTIREESKPQNYMFKADGRVPPWEEPEPPVAIQHAIQRRLQRLRSLRDEGRLEEVGCMPCEEGLRTVFPYDHEGEIPDDFTDSDNDGRDDKTGLDFYTGGGAGGENENDRCTIPTYRNFFMGTVDINLAFQDLSFFNRNMVLPLLGHVNNSTFRGIPRGTLMFVGAKPSWEYDTAGQVKFSMSMAFKFRLFGWNKLYCPEKDKWLWTNPPLYPYADFVKGIKLILLHTP